jgi:Methyltransferase FkbM domain
MTHGISFLSQRIIDVLKIDVEGGEWPFLRDLAIDNPNQLSSIRQIIVEVHSPKVRPQVLNAADFIEMNYYFDQLLSPLDSQSNSGFAVFGNRHYLSCCGVFAGMMPSNIRETCCHEVSLLNVRFLNRSLANN